MAGSYRTDMNDLIIRPVGQSPQLAGLMPKSLYVKPARPVEVRRLWFVLLRRKWQILAIVLLTVLPTAIYNFYATPYYSSSARIQIDPEPVKALSYQSGDADSKPDYQNFDLYFQTQAEILKGDRLSERVASRLGFLLAASKDARPAVEKLSLGQRIGKTFQTAMRGFFRYSVPESKVIYEGGISVSPIKNTRLIELSYSSADPVIAAVVVNVAAEEFIKLHASERDEISERAAKSLNAQLNIFRVKVEKSEQALIKYARENGILSLTDKDQDVIRQRLEKLNDKMTQVEAQFIAKSANYDAIKTASPSDLPSGLRTNNTIISDLEKRFAEIEQRIAILTSQYDENWPDVLQARKELARVQLQLVKEEEATYSRALHQAKMEQEAARQEYQMLSTILLDQKDATHRLNQASVQYNNLKRNVDMNQQLYQALLQRLKETGLSTGVQFDNINIVQKAKPAITPSSPRTMLNLAVALILGLILSLGLAFIAEYTDQSLKTVQDLEDFTGLPSLASLPMDARTRQELDFAREPKRLIPVVPLDPRPTHAVVSNSASYIGSQSQAFREACIQLRTSILLANPDRVPQVILVTSAIPLEGKTTVAAQLANVLARADAHTILLDLDMRRPELSRRFGANGDHHGMSVFLSGNSPGVTDFVQTENPYLVLVPAGPKPPNPADLIGSERMKLALDQLREWFRFILIDTPPILTVADAMALAPLVDGVVLVVGAGKTPREIVSRAIAEMRRSGGRILGLVFNGVNCKFPDQSCSQKYYGYGHYDESNC
jgi:polysaccharide biosynthesis transport protein